VLIGPVVIDVPPSIAAELADVAAERCSSVLGAGRCLVGDSGPPDAAYSALIVPEDGSLLRVRVELRRGPADGPLLQSREISFVAADSLDERLGSLGVLVAALVMLWDSKPLDPAPAPAPAKSESPAAPEPPPKARPSPRFEPAVDAGAFVADGLERPPLQPGGALRVLLAYEPWRAFGMLGSRYAGRLGTEPELNWVSLDAGFGTRIGPWRGFWALELHAEAEWQSVTVVAADEVSGRSEQAGTSRFGLRLGLDGSFRIVSDLRAIVGLEGAVLRPEVLVDVRDTTVDRVRPVAVGAFAGLRFVP
jgi:hypothetical protein